MKFSIRAEFLDTKLVVFTFRRLPEETPRAIVSTVRRKEQRCYFIGFDKLIREMHKKFDLFWLIFRVLSLLLVAIPPYSLLIHSRYSVPRDLEHFFFGYLFADNSTMLYYWINPVLVKETKSTGKHSINLFLVLKHFFLILWSLILVPFVHCIFNKKLHRTILRYSLDSLSLFCQYVLDISARWKNELIC